ncbi:MAG: DUF3467 domain-containing protein [Candidatus Brocadiaceae bacterium]|nr:DUF3467 domain-containing protein [Candidatus Brocadiaceae bacterium]
MAEEKKIISGSPAMVERFFEQPPDAISCYSDFAQVMHTGNEILLQFYETIPGPPVPGGNIGKVRSRLRATITISVAHAQNIGKLLTERAVAFEVKK